MHGAVRRTRGALAEPLLERVEIGGQQGLWFAAPHELVYVDRQGLRHTETARLAGPTLVWSDGRVTYRLEGVSDFTEAVAIAASVS